MGLQDLCDLEEKKIYCSECNGYLYSTSIFDDRKQLTSCPFVKDPIGECTGILPNRNNKL